MMKWEMPGREAVVCRRLREARVRLGLTQEEVARQIGTKRSQIANYEYLRTPVPLGDGLWFCRQFGIGERWLAVGEGREDQLLDLREVFRTKDLQLFEIPEIPFGEGYELYLKAEADAWIRDHPDWWWRVHLDQNWEPGDFMRNLLARTFDRILEELPALARPKLFIRMEAAGFEFLREVAAAKASPPIGGMASLTRNSVKRNNSGVVPTLPQLLHRVRSATGQRGSKAQLAGILNVPPSRLSEWLSGKAEPSGSTALRLLAWLLENEEGSGPRTTHNPKP